MLPGRSPSGSLHISSDPSSMGTEARKTEFDGVMPSDYLLLARASESVGDEVLK